MQRMRMVGRSVTAGRLFWETRRWKSGRRTRRSCAADVSLSPGELAEVEEVLSHIVIHGNRTDEDIQRMGYVKPQ